MSELSFYENVIPSPKKRKNLVIKITIISAYVIFLAVWILSAFISRRNPALIILVVTVASVVAALALRPLSVEFEYYISDSQITLAKIYGKSRRREMFSADTDSILLIAPETEENIKKAEAYQPREQYRMATKSADKKAWIVVFENDKDEKFLFTFDAEDYVTKILKQLKPSAISFR